jgi:probable phosphoglycerate mutase
MLLNATEKWSAPPRRRVYLMRHGEVDYFDAGGRPFKPETVGLNAEGRRQAEAAARALAGVPLDRAVCSGLNRTAETARLVLAGRDVPLEREPRLREIETGRLTDWASASAAQVERAVLGALGPGLEATSRFLGGETFGALQERVGACWAELLARRDWRHLLIVAHGVVNRLLLCGLLGGGLAGLAALEQDAGCVNLIEVGDAGAGLVRLVNFTPASPLKQGLEHSTLEGLYRQYLQGRAPGAQPG